MALEDFGVQNAPQVTKLRSLTLGGRYMGHICRKVADGRVCYVTKRDSEDHRYRGEDPWYDLSFEGEGYGISIELFEPLYESGVGAVYIAETDTDTVYHFSRGQFVDGDPINYEDEDGSSPYWKDIQMVVPIEEAVDSWEGHASALIAKQPSFR